MRGMPVHLDEEALLPVIPTIRRFMGYMAPHRLKLAVVILLIAVFALFNGVFSLLIGRATNIISAGPGPVEPLYQVIFWLAAGGLVIWVAGAVSQKLLSDISQEALYRLRIDLFAHIQTMSLDFFDRRPIGELMSRVTNDTQVIEQFISIGSLQTG
jgi:ABC-type multidrug transport system fused ATPase/permease subunit